MYVEQAKKRYAPLFGQQLPSWRKSGGWFSWGSSKSDSSSYLSDGHEYDSSFSSSDRDELSPARRGLSGQKHKYFFAINLYNSFDVIPDLFATLFRVAAILGYHNIYVSIYENGSTDQTKALLRIFDALAQTAGLRVEIRTSMRTRGAFNHRIEYLAEVRNAALVPLHELRENKQEVFDSIVFMNDILPCVDDLLELIWQSRTQNAGITCASDYMFHDDIVRCPSRASSFGSHRSSPSWCFSTFLAGFSRLLWYV
jgi:alpha-1,3-mannosyltransferase